MAKKRSHRWTYPTKHFQIPRVGNPATCECGAKHYYRTRDKSSRGMGSARFYGTTTEDWYFVEPDGNVIVNPKPVPGCTR